MKTPDSIIRELSEVRTNVARNAQIVRDYESAAMEAQRQLDHEFALAYKRASGSIEDRKQQAVIDTESFAHARDDTKIALNYAKARARGFESELSNLQTQARMVELTYKMAGVGET
ncbi:hypothetical protein [Brevibacterium otitidis]|uniref:Uncharacterized protein n=1 Tax=Brevibacterium otitidis TaxID=53364 RepID=A0ABV5X329_9MICO